MMEIILIAAVAKNRVIGKGNDLVWKLPEDFKRFKAITSGNYILMGRKTFESLGKPLPNRTHLVITRDSSYSVPEGHHIFSSLEDAVTYAQKADAGRLYVIGGGEIYKQSLAIADKMNLTEVDAEPEGDTYFPEFSKENWEETFREFHPADERHEYSFSFVDYEKVKK
jgi:dihydrofolate reductase